MSKTSLHNLFNQFSLPVTLPPSSNINGLSDPSQFAVAPLASGDDLLAQLLTETSPTGPVSQPSSQSIVPVVPVLHCTIVPVHRTSVPVHCTIVPDLGTHVSPCH